MMREKQHQKKTQITRNKSQKRKVKKKTKKAKKIKLRKVENQNKIYDLEERTAIFAEQVRDFCLKLPKNAANAEYIPQLIRSGSSPGANYIEANESIGEKDFLMKIKTCRRESKESAYWVRLVLTDGSTEQENQRAYLRLEAKEFIFIFTAILKKRMAIK
jgi:four helix bundle protein